MLYKREMCGDSNDIAGDCLEILGSRVLQVFLNFVREMLYYSSSGQRIGVLPLYIYTRKNVGSLRLWSIARYIRMTESSFSWDS